MSQDDRCPPEDLLMPAIGAMLFASGETVHPQEVLQAFKQLPKDQVVEAVDQLEAALAGSGTGLRVEKVAGGFRLATSPEVGAWVRQFFRHRNRTRLTPAALETLAIVAYRQPVTAPEIQAIRAKDPSAALKSLVDKKLVRILGKKKVVGNPLLYGTSKHFLVHFGLNNLGDLPSLEDFDEFVDAVGAGQVALFSEPVTEDEEIERMEASGGGPEAEAQPEAEPVPAEAGPPEGEHGATQ